MDNLEQKNSNDPERRTPMLESLNRRADVVEQLVQSVEQQLLEAVKPTVTDYIRLVELQDALVERAPSGVDVQWIDVLDELDAA